MQKNFYPGQETEINQLVDIIREHPRLFVISGAGISTASGIPDYRDREGNWKRPPPIMHHDFIRSEQVRKRYWARSLAGWRFFRGAEPNVSHRALYEMEQRGYVQTLVTQNVDGLHQRAGSRSVIDLHGRIDTLACLGCRREERRDHFQQSLEQMNPSYLSMTAAIAPDGDADLEQVDFDDFTVPCCTQCGGVYMPKVVFYGGSVPKQRVATAYRELGRSDAVLVAGSSLMVYSAYQFCRHAVQTNIPVLAINQGRTRHDGNYRLKLEAPCEQVLERLAAALSS